MGVSRDKLLKDLLPELNNAFKDAHETTLINKIIANEEQSARYKKELEDAIQRQER